MAWEAGSVGQEDRAVSTTDAEEMESSTVTAFCAPGRMVLAAFTLMVRGVSADQIVEHPWLEGFGDVIVGRDPEAFRAEPEFSVTLARFRVCGLCGSPEPGHNAWCVLRMSPEVEPWSLLRGGMC